MGLLVWGGVLNSWSSHLHKSEERLAEPWTVREGEKGLSGVGSWLSPVGPNR